MWGDVNVTVEDGNLGIATTTGKGTHFKIGISSIISTVPILITGTMKPSKIKEKLGLSPLADACIDSVENGSSKIYCIPVDATTPGTVGNVTKTGTGTGTLEITGTPNNRYDIEIQIAENGGFNQGTIKVSVDGGYSFTDEITIPLNGEYEISQTGLKAVFREGAEASLSFASGDMFVVSTTAPAMSNADVITAVESLINNTTQFEFIHIVGESGKALWSALAEMANQFLTAYRKPCFFVCEAKNKTKEETLDQYLAAALDEAKGINNRYIQVVKAYSSYTRADGRVQDINNAGIVCGLYGLAKESQSIGEVKSFAISESKMTRLLPDGIEDYLKVLDEAKYLTFRKYEGCEGYFVSNALMLSSDGSDYRYAEDIRVSNRLIKAVRQKALQELQIEVDMDDLENSLAIIQEELNTPMEDAMDDKIISSGTVTIDMENLNILADESINIQITYVPKGHLRDINLSFAMENPYRN